MVLLFTLILWLSIALTGFCPDRRSANSDAADLRGVAPKRGRDAVLRLFYRCVRKADDRERARPLGGADLDFDRRRVNAVYRT